MHFVIGQEVKLLEEKNNLITFKYASEYFTAPSNHFVDQFHWKEIVESVKAELKRLRSIRKQKNARNKINDRRQRRDF